MFPAFLLSIVFRRLKLFMINKNFYRWTALGTVLLLLLTVFSVAPMGITSAHENSEQGQIHQQDGLTSFQRTHAQLVEDSRASADSQPTEATPRYDVIGDWMQACTNGTDTDVGVPEGWCNVLATAQNAPTTTGSSSGRMVENPVPNMLTTTNAWESHDLNYVWTTYLSGHTPPDTMGAVGPTQFVVTQNGVYRFHDKLTGVPDVLLDTTAEGFWPVSVDPTANAGGDPRVRYDRVNDQWIIIAFNRDIVNRIVVARSDGPIISLATVWTFWYFIPGSSINGAADAGCFIDYPMLGVDSNAYVIGANIFTGSVSCSNSSVYVLPRTTLPPGGGDASPTTYAYTGVRTCASDNPCASSPMPADTYEVLPNSYVVGQSFWIASSTLR